MRVVALISGGKDSCFNMMQCVAAGHEIVALANLEPIECDEIDSYMYQTVGHDGIFMYSDAMGLPLFRRKITGNAVVKDKEYSPTDGDEVEDLFLLLTDIRAEIDFDAIAVGAILSDYQRIRVENVCTRLGCVCLAYLWRRDQSELLQEMIDCGINAIIVKTASLGLDPDVHLGQTIAEMKPHLIKSKKKYGINVCGEGGEYETFTLDCPLFRQAIVLDEYEKVIHSNDAFAPVGYLKLNRMHLVKKTASLKSSAESSIDELDESSHSDPTIPIPANQKQLLHGLPIKSPLDYLSDLIECHIADCCDGHMELCTQNHGNRDGDDDDEEGEGENFRGGHHDRVKSPKLEISRSAGSISQSLLLGDPGVNSTEISKSRDVETLRESPVSGSDPNISNVSASTPSPVLPSPTTPVSCPCQSKSVREKLHFPVSQRITNNAEGWFWIMGIHDKDLVSQNKIIKNRREEQSERPNVPQCNNGSTNSMKNALESLQRVLEERNLRLMDLVGVVIYVSDMSDYAQYNKEYLEVFSSRPPIRICVEAPLPLEIPVLLEALAFRNQNANTEGDIHSERQCMHVQGISHWAPANIGPYSQAVWVGDIIYVAGQIGLVPGSMALVEGGARIECKLALRHISRIIKAVDPKVEMRDVVQGICYVTDSKFIEECRREWEKRTNNAIVEYLVVPRLPRDANVEWQVWVHKHNTAFEYEETGCYIGTDVKVRLIRRWNYECRVAVIVCTALICNTGARFGRSEMIGMTEYALSKLNQESDHQKSDEKSQECAIRVFYRLGTVNPSDVEEVLGNQSSKYNVAFSIIPVCFLVKENAVISFCGVRHK